MQSTPARKGKISFRFKVLAATGIGCLIAWGLSLYALFHYAF